MKLTSLANLLVFCIILSYPQYVCLDIFNWNKSYNNHCHCFTDTDKWNVWSINNRRFRYSELNCYATTTNITMNYCRTDYFFEWNMTKSNIKQKLLIMNTLQASSNISHQSIICNNNKTVHEYNINTNSYSIFQQCPKNITRLFCINFYSSSKLIHKYDLDYVSKSFTNYFNNLQYKFSTCYYEVKHLLLAIKYRFNGLFAYIIILIMAFISVIIILLDIFKYRFNLGSMKEKLEEIEKNRPAKKCSKEYKPTIINIPKLETIHEEDEVES